MTEHNCHFCGKPLERKRYPSKWEVWANFWRRKYCDRQCMADAYEGQIKVPTWANSRRQSQKQAKPACELCGRLATETQMYVHHRDENPMNNDPTNLQTLCGSCHRREHLDTWGAPCIHCDRPRERRDLCGTHLSREKRYGHALAKKRKVGKNWVLMKHDGTDWSPL